MADEVERAGQQSRSLPRLLIPVGVMTWVARYRPVTVKAGATIRWTYICAALPLPALRWRIRVEEAELTAVLGDRYRAYQAHTKRLIPGLW